MSKTSDFFYSTIKEQQFADPFCNEFDNEKLRAEFSSLNKEESDILDFLQVCHGLYRELLQNIFSSFEQLSLSPEGLREFCYYAVNKQFLEIVPQIEEHSGISHEVEKTSFAKFVNGHGNEINAKLAIELGCDILAELISLSYEWTTINKKEIISLQDINYKVYENLFHTLWINTNILLNIRNTAYHIIKYENGKVNIRNESEIKIETGLPAFLFLKNVGLIRANNNVQEYIIQLLSFYQQYFKERIGVNNIEIKGNVLSPKKGKSDTIKKASADASLIIFYPHFSDMKLGYFDDLHLFDLLNLLVLTEESAEKLLQQNMADGSAKQQDKVPIKFNKKELISFLSEVTGHKYSTVEKFIFSITCNGKQPCFWRTPFIQEGDYLFFSLVSISAPNHVLYLDRWTTLSGYTLDAKEKKFVEFVKKELTEDKIKYEFKIINFENLKLDTKKFSNNILIETKSLLVLLEIKIFDFPIESAEVDAVLQRLRNASVNVGEKAKQIFDDKKEIVKIIVTNYTNFSGICFNNVPIADLTLLKNYISVGNFRRVSMTYHNDESKMNDGSIIHYYRNEDEFNDNLKKFFANPFPIKYILRRLCLIEHQITHDFVRPKFIIDSIDHITDDQLIDSRIDNLESLLNYEYFGEPDDKVIKDLLDQSVLFSLTEIFSQLSYAPYESYSNRIELYHSISKTKLLGFAHLVFFIFKSLEKLNEKRIKPQKYFGTVDYTKEEIFEILEKKKIISGQIRLSEFIIDNDRLSHIEEKKTNFFFY